MSYSIVGCSPGRVYTPDELVKGVCPARGTRARTHDGKEYILCEVSGTQVTVSGSIGRIGTLAPAAGVSPFRFSMFTAGDEVVTKHGAVGAAIVSVTASASMLIWVQIYGACSLIASLSSLPYVQLRPSITGTGTVDDGITSLSTVIDGAWLTATSGLQDTATAAWLNYPVMSRQSIA